MYNKTFNSFFTTRSNQRKVYMSYFGEEAPRCRALSYAPMTTQISLFIPSASNSVSNHAIQRENKYLQNDPSFFPALTY